MPANTAPGEAAYTALGPFVKNALSTNYIVNYGSEIDNGSNSAAYYGASSDWTSWTVESSSSVVSPVGTKSLRVAANSGTGTYVRIDKDFGSGKFRLNTGDQLDIFVYAPRTQAFGFVLYLSADGNYVNYYQGSVSSSIIRAGWNHFVIPVSSLTANGSISLNQLFRRWRINFNITSTANYPEIYFGGIYINARSRPKVLIGFDDGFATQYSVAAPVMMARRMPFYIGVIGALVGAGAYVTETQLVRMYNAGVDTLVHGANTLTGLANQAAMEADIASNKTWLTSRGMTRGSDHYIYPGGIFAADPNDFTPVAAVQAQGFRSARAFASSHTIVPTAYSYGETYHHNCRNLGTNTVATHVTQLDAAIAAGATFHVAGHDILNQVNPGGTGGSVPVDGNQYYRDDLESLCDTIMARVAAGKCDVVSFTDWWNGLAQPIVPRRPNSL